MNKNILRVLWLLFLLYLPVSVASAADFSADMISKEGLKTTQSKVYVSGAKMRMEMPESTMIIRNDQRVSWILMPGEQMYMEHPVNVSRAPRTSANFDNEIERTPLGADTVDGQTAEKFQVTYVENGKNVAVYQWLVNQFPVKTEAVNGSWGTEYKNLVMGSQPADLFEIPADYEKMEMPSMGSLMGMMGQ